LGLHAIRDNVAGMIKSPDKHVGTRKPPIKQRSRVKPKPELANAIEQAAERALAEAAARRAAETTQDMPEETGGRNGPEPTRFGDWEKKGLISDF
jgi:hypothetical protein